MEKNDNFIKKCDICKEDATSLCFNCNQYFCESCYKFIHSKKINSQHKKENIDLYVPIDLRCEKHPNIPLNLFCFNEKGKINIFHFYRTLLFILCF